MFVTTKLPPDHAGRARRTLTESLAALGTDHLDLWLIHWPPGRQASPETWQVFREVRDEGLVRSIGVSNYSIAQLDELIAATGEAPAVNQIPYSPRDHDPDLLAAHRERGIVVEGYSPLKRTDLGAAALTDAAHGPRRDARAGGAALARPARRRGHPEVDDAGADRDQPRRPRVHADRRGDGGGRRAGLTGPVTPGRRPPRCRTSTRRAGRCIGWRSDTPSGYGTCRISLPGREVEDRHAPPPARRTRRTAAAGGGRR